MIRIFLASLLIALGMQFSHAQELKIVNYEELEHILSSSPDKPKLINCWATWCKPCVEELPYFSAMQKEANSNSPEMIFISLDFLSQTRKAEELIRKLSLNGTLLQLNQPGGDWIDAFDSDWSGAIPYTVLLLPGGEKIPYYDAFNSLDELKSFVNKNLVN